MQESTAKLTAKLTAKTGDCCELRRTSTDSYRPVTSTDARGRTAADELDRVRKPLLYPLSYEGGAG